MGVDTKYRLDQMQRVDLRTVWPHEALDFTRWLSEEPNLNLLGSAVGIELELIDTQHERVGIEFYVPDDKEIGRKAIKNTPRFEECLGLNAKPFDAKKASGLRFYRDGCKIKGNEDAWPDFIREQLGWALAMKELVCDLGL